MNGAGYYMDELEKVVRGWLIKANHDLLTAAKLARGDDAYLDTAIYHCQQPAEKAVKGFLTYHGCRFEKTHDIQRLVLLAEDYADTFSNWYDAAELLTPYATEFRYPGDVMEPTAEEFAEAFQAANQLHAFVLSHLPRAVHPSSSLPGSDVRAADLE